MLPTGRATAGVTTRLSYGSAPGERRGTLLQPGATIASGAARVEFVVADLLGKGGYGEAYLARVKGRGSSSWPTTVCVKVTTALKSWICEAYFGFLLEGQDRALHLYEATPLRPPAAGRPGLYALVFELAPHGDLAGYLCARARPCTETYVRREVRALLDVLDVLHRGRAFHQDLTPFNVFVCDGECLKLGDFGIAKHNVRDAVPVSALNPGFAPIEVVAGKSRRWRARDDIYQVGQLLAMLLKGDATKRLTSDDVRRLSCSDQMKEIIQRCIGTARKRFEKAGELIDALNAKPRVERRARVTTLRGQRIVFTGRLAVERKEAARLARRAGATVENRVTAQTNVVIRGIPSPVQKAGAVGSKLIDVAFWRERGNRIAVIREKRFWRLIGRTPPEERA